MSRSRAIFRTTSLSGFLALLAGGVHATLAIAPRTWVREFQAGRASGFGEKLDAIVQSAGIEGVGFLLVGLALALAAGLLLRGLPHFRADGEGSGYGGALVLCAGAFFGWTAVAWIAEDALAFLTRPEVLALDALAVITLVAALVFLDLLLRQCPWAARASEANALGTLGAAALGTWAALRVLKSGEAGWREPTLLALAGVGYLAAVPVGAALGRALALPVRPLRAWLRRERLFPLWLSAPLWCAYLGALAWTGARFELSPLAGEPSYSTLAPRPAGSGPNVVLVTVDTLRADHLGCYGYGRPTSPFLDSLAREGTRCADATAAASWTKPATGTILTGLHPSRHGALYHGSLLNLPEGEITLAEAFRQRGYVTAGFVANPNLKRVFEFDRGFDVYFDSPVEDTVTLACIRGTWFGGVLMRFLRHQFNWNYENDIARMNAEVLAWLRANPDQRFFLYAHYIDPHIPYDPPARYRREFARDHPFLLFNARKRAVGIDRYDGEIRYTDDGLAELVGELRRLGLWDDTLFVLTSDHGEEFFEHGVLGHGFSLFQEVVRVPLVFRGPGVPAGAVIEEPVQILDLAGTVLELAGGAGGRFGDGRSFAARVRSPAGSPPEPIFMESEFGQDDSNHRAFVFTGVRLGRWKLVLTEENEFFPPEDRRHGREALFDLSQDPGERENLFRAEERQEFVAGLLDRLRTHALFLQEHGFRDVPPAVLTPEVQAELEALGDLGGE
jgi:arylsulfatase